MRRIRRAAFIAAASLAAAAAPVFAQHPWSQYSTPEEAGFSSAALDSIRRVADSLRTGAVVIVYRGNVLAAWGDVNRKLQLHSVRKSLTSSLYGIAVGAGRINLEESLDALGIDDTTKLTAAEKTARIRDIIAARSGVYLPAAYAPSDQDSTRPPRGSHARDTFWFYNNWDFNTAETIYQMKTGQSVYDGFDRLIARPIGMEDFTTGDGFLAWEPGLSRFPAHTWRMSARDLARFGQLYLQKGKWKGKQVVPADWVALSTAPASDFGEGRGYGYMWWTYAAGSYGDRYPSLQRYASFAGTGTGGQAVIVVPDADIVVVQRGDTDHGRNISGARAWAIVDAVLAARRGTAVANPSLVPVSPVPFASQLPPVVAPTVLPSSQSEVAAMVGEYEMGAPTRMRIYLFMGRLFAYLPGQGEAELFRTGEWQYTVKVTEGVTSLAERNELGKVTAIVITIGGRRFVGRRVD